jgi:hypothetical protein
MGGFAMKTGQVRRAFLVVAGIVLASLALAACESPTPADQGPDRSPPPASAVPTVAETTDKSPLATGTTGPQPVAPSPTPAPATRSTLAPASSLEAKEVITAPANPPIPTPTDPTMQKLVQQAQEDLAQRLGIDEAQIELVAFEFVTWSDKSYGCPKPGMGYIQIPQDGVFIQLRAAKRLYDYHWGSGGPPFLCEQ